MIKCNRCKWTIDESIYYANQNKQGLDENCLSHYRWHLNQDILLNEFTKLPRQVNREVKKE